MPSYLLLLNEAANTDGPAPSADEIQATIARYRAWRDKLGTKILSGEKLVDEPGRAMSQVSGKLEVTDGPYAEVKEAIAGFFILKADSYEEAASMCEDCPHLDFGTIQIRQIDDI